MNAEHVRPIVAFCCVAAAAAVVTALGLRAETPRVQVRAGVPATVQPTDDLPGLVLGNALTALPSASGTQTTPASFPSVVENYTSIFATLSGLLDEMAVRTAPTVAGSHPPAPADSNDVAEGRASSTSSPTAPAGDGGSTGFPGRGNGSGHADDNAGDNAGGKGRAGQGAQGEGKG